MGNVIRSLRRRLFAILALTVSLAGVLLADVFVDLTVDPPEVLEDWPCVSDCRRDASGISFAIDDASCDLVFAFLGLPEDAEVCYLLHAGGQVVSSGYGTALPLADHPDADRVEFFSPDGSADWGAVTSVRAERAEIRPSGRAPYASAAAASADGPRLAEDRPGLAAGPRATHVVDGARAVAEEAGFDYREPGVWTDPDWEGLDRPAKWLTVLTGFSGSYPYWQGVFTTGLSCYTYLPAGGCSYCVGADDNATLAIGALGVSSIDGEHGFRWGNTVSASVEKACFMPLTVTYGNIGGPYSLDFSGGPFGLFGSGTNVAYAGLLIQPKAIWSPSVPDRRGIREAVVSITNADPRVSYDLVWEPEKGRAVWSGTNWLYSVDIADLDPAADTNIVFRLRQTCRDAVSEHVTTNLVVNYYDSTKPAKREVCGCVEGGAETVTECISFVQRFGTTPAVSSAPWGRVLIEEEFPNAALATPAVLRYDHPAWRRLSGTATGPAVVIPPVGQPVRYRDGHPVGESVTLDSRLRDVPDAPVPTVREIFSDRSEVVYTNGVPCAIVTPDGVRTGVSDLGIEVVRAADGSIRQLRSVTDGLMDVVPGAAGRFRIDWYAPSSVGARDPATGLWQPAGPVAKAFDFGTPPDGATGISFAVEEIRSPELVFRTRWDWSDAAQDWSMTKGTGDGALSVSRTIAFADDGTFTVSKVSSSSAGVASETVSTYSFENGIALVSEDAGGSRLRSVVRGAAGNGLGRPVRTVERSGLVTSVAYDAEGRVLSETESGGPVSRRTVYAYAADTETPDFTPVRTERYAGGVLVSTETYGREGTAASGLVERTTVAVGSVARTNLVTRHPASSANVFEAGRVALSVSADGSAVTNVYEAAAGALYVHTATRGVWTDGVFRTVDGKSTRTRLTYDACGNVVRAATDALTGGTWRELSSAVHTYSLIHQRLSTVRSDGRTSDSSRICTGALWTRDEDGIVTTNAYDSAKRMVRSVRHGPLGAVTTDLALDAEGRTLAETRTAPGLAPETERTAYDSEGRVVSRTDAQGRTTRTVRSDDALLTTDTFADGGTRVTRLNADGSLASVTGTAVKPEYHTYGVTADGLEWTCVRYGRPDSPRYEKTYRNGFGETIRTERPGFGGATIVTENAYDAKGHLVSTSETGSPTVTYAYDDWGDLIETTQSAGGVTRTVEESQGYALLDGEVWHGGARTVLTSDATIAPLVTASWSKASGLSLGCIDESFTVDVRGNTNRTWSALDPSAAKRTIRSQQAGVGNVAFTESTDGVTVRTVDAGCVTNTAAYDAYRRTVATADGRGNVTATAYDPFGRVSSVTDATNAVTRYVYDTMGRVTEVTNALGGVTFTRYDLRGNKTYEGGATYPVSYAYDIYGNRTSMTTYRTSPDVGEASSPPQQGRSQIPLWGGEDAAPTAGDTTTWAFDEATGLVTQKLYADGRGPCYTYTDDGNLATRTWARGVTTSYTYDAWGSLTSTTYSDATPSVTFAYDALGRRTSVTDAKGTTVFTYDAFGDESQEAVTGLYAKTLVRHRDAYGRDLGHTMDGTRKNVIEYDAATGRISREQLGGAWYAWSYLPGTHLKASLSVGTAATTTWTYEPHRDLLTQVKNTVYGAVASQYDYENDALGHRTAIGRSGTMMGETRSDAYGYNDRSELVSAAKNGVTEYAYQYDDIGNRESSVEPDNSFSYSANELNQYTSILQLQLPTPTDFTPQYDEDGNQTLVKTKTGIWQVVYNGENRPVSWTCGATNLVMSYDHMGRRVEYVETVADPVESTIATNKHQRFVYDKYLCIQRLNGANNAVTDLFEWDPTEPVATRPLYWQPRTSQGNFSLFYTHDGNKNVSEAVFYQRARGVAAHYEYAPFGEVTAQTRGNAWGTLDLAADNPWRFSSEYADDATATVYYNYRHYEPVTGRWMQRDPLEEAGGVVNLYSCLANTFGEYSDWLGQVPVPPIFTTALREAAIEFVKQTASSLMSSWFDTMLDEGTLVSDASTTGCGSYPYVIKDRNGFHSISLNSPRESSFLKQSLRDGLKAGAGALVNQIAAGYLKKNIRKHASKFLKAKSNTPYYEYYKKIENLITKEGAEQLTDAMVDIIAEQAVSKIGDVSSLINSVVVTRDKVQKIKWVVEDGCRICAIIKESYKIEMTIMGKKEPPFNVSGSETMLRCFDFDELGEYGPAGRQARKGCGLCPCKN